MKHLLFLSLIFMISCGNKKQDTTDEQIDFPKYNTVIEMLEANLDYKGANLELISENPLHIRVSSDFVKEESRELTIERTKRDIIYVAFQAFATTEIDEFTITSIPIERVSFNPNLPYDGKLINSLKQTKKVSRTKAQKILEKYLNTDSFKDLYQISGTLYLPNDKFDILVFKQLNNVFNGL